MTDTDIECYRGDTTEWLITASRDGTPIDLTGATITMTAKRGFAYPNYVFQRTTGNGITIDPDQSTNTGKATIKLAQTSTADLPADITKLRYDIQVLTASGDLMTVLYGVLTVYPDVSV